MSRLEELIQQYCPDGVEYKPLKDILRIRNGRDYKHLDKGLIPVYGSGGIMTYVDTPMYSKPSVLIPRKGSIDKLYYVDTPFWNVDTVFYTEIDTSKVVEKYVYYVLQKEHLEKLNTAGGVPSLTQGVLNEVLIPVPPLPVQEEIVRILDNFAELQTELQAELQKRLQQYNYYRDKLLTFNELNRGGQSVSVEYKKLGEICNLSRGKVYSKSYIEENAGEYPVYSSQTANNGELGRISTYDYDGEYLTWTTDGAYAGTIFYRKGKFSITNVCGLISPKEDNLNIKFLFYWLSIKAPDYVYRGMGNPKLMSNQMEPIKVPILPLAEQQRIVEVLDRFDTLTNDITAGLPAEIEARRKQYEYYRDKLLTFKQKA